MASIHPFRQLRWGPPRPLSTPHFLRKPRPRLGGLGRYFGFIMLAAMIAAAAIVLTPWRDPGTVRKGPKNIHVIDGDTLRIEGERIRLIGIDAPEIGQTCRDANGTIWTCGR